MSSNADELSNTFERNEKEKEEEEKENNNDEFMGNEICEILPENSQVKSDLSFKIIVIGNSGVGKTCLALRALKGSFSEDSIPTIGFEFLNILVKLNSKIISLQVWDTCGQEAYQSVVSKFYKRAAMAILVYSINDRKSFDSLDTWLNELRSNASSDIKIALVGNKVDLKSERCISKEEALNYKISRKLDLIFESSAKHGDNSRDIFTEAAITLYKDYIAFTTGSSSIKGYGDGNHPYSLNAKLPGKESIRLTKDSEAFDDGSQGSCTKC